MTLIGKLFVLLNMVLAVIFGAFVLINFHGRNDWKDKTESLRDQLTTARAAKIEAENDLTVKLDAMEKDRQRWAQEKADLEAKVTQETLKYDTEKKRADSAEVDLRKQKDENATLATRLSATESDYQNASAKLIEAEDRVTQLETQLRDRDLKIATTVDERERLKLRNAQMRTDYDELYRFATKIYGKEPSAPDFDRYSDTPLPPPDNVKGLVQRVSADGKTIQLSVGTDDGFRKGHILEVWRTQGGPRYIGQVRIIQAEPTLSIARPINVAGKIQAKDEAAAKILISKKPKTSK